MVEEIFARFKPESWETARAYAANVGDVPPAFASLVKTIQSDLVKDPSGSALSDSSRSQLKRLLRSDSFRASFYYSLRITHSEELEGAGNLNIRTLSKFMDAEDLCFFLLVMFYFKRFQKHLLSQDSWGEFSTLLCSRADIGMLVGRCLESVGIGAGLLGATAQYLGCLAFMVHDKEGFGRYRKRCMKDGVFFSPESEQERWGCNALQVFAYLGQNFGLRRPIIEGMVYALDSQTELSDIPKKEFYRFRIAKEWTESLISTGNIPEMTHRGEFYPVESHMEVLRQDVQRLEQLSGSKSWLKRTGEDLSPELTPQLYGAAQATSASSEEAPEEPDDNSPNEFEVEED